MATKKKTAIKTKNTVNETKKTVIETKKKLIVLCDGTWCGAETGTQTNIYLLARMIMNDQDPNAASPYHDTARDIRACYFPGVGLGGTFLEYLFNGATGSDIGRDCLDVYRYIVQHFTEDHEIWMFGLSRGAYTVRCVAGMINNCGILKRKTNNNNGLTGEENDLCNDVYKIYRSPDPEDRPDAQIIREFRTKASYNVLTPVKFMGLLDTVGSLGVPKLDAGVGLTFPEFYDQNVSSVVEKVLLCCVLGYFTVAICSGRLTSMILSERLCDCGTCQVYHALSIHDRLWCFQPCRALRDDKHRGNTNLQIHERWFPGCHYDIGRQKFRFLRDGQSWLERAASNISGPLSGVVKPNEVLADLVQKWMLECIKSNSANTVIPNVDARINSLNGSMMAANRDIGSGDVYSPVQIIMYAPLGLIWHTLVYPALTPFQPITNISQVILDDIIILLGPIGKGLEAVISIINAILGTLRNIPVVGWIANIPGNLANDTLSLFAPIGVIWRDLANIFSSLFLFHEFRIIIDALAQTRDRRISDNAEVTKYNKPDLELSGSTIDQLGQVDARYPSQTYYSFTRFLGVLGRAVRGSP